MRSAGVDHGGRWIGLALSDPLGSIAQPLENIDGEAQAIARIKALMADRGVARVVVGLPRNMDGSLGPRAQAVLRFVEKLRAEALVEVEPWDERLTTAQAERSLEAAGFPRRRWAEKVNQVSAQIILQSFLDAERARAQPPEPPEEAETDVDEEPTPP